MAAAYPWLKALHIVAVVAWMAGLLYLPRLFVYHAEAPLGSDRAATFKIMERRLLRGIMMPAMVADLCASGSVLAAIPGMVDWQRGWIWAKLGLVLLLTVFHVLLARWRRDFAAERNRALGAVFPNRQRAADLGDDRDRRARGGQAVLTDARALR